MPIYHQILWKKNKIKAVIYKTCNGKALHRLMSYLPASCGWDINKNRLTSETRANNKIIINNSIMFISHQTRIFVLLLDLYEPFEFLLIDSIQWFTRVCGLSILIIQIHNSYSNTHCMIYFWINRLGK